MREVVKELIEQSILFEYKLPNENKNIESSKYSNYKDFCFSNDKYEKISELIYNSIIDYANNEYEIDETELNNEQKATIISKLRYTESQDMTTKKKYGFYGEVLLYCILVYFFGTDVLISKGYFYNVLDASEPKGYDSFHIIQREQQLELWFGEAKCYEEYTDAINSVLNNIEKALSSEYLSMNLIAIIKENKNLNILNGQIEKLCKEWKGNPVINLKDQISKYNMKLIYPILIVADKKNKEYDQCIRDCIEHIEKEFNKRKPNFSNEINSSVFFMFLPIESVGKMKEKVIEWISMEKQLKL